MQELQRGRGARSRFISEEGSGTLTKVSSKRQSLTISELSVSLRDLFIFFKSL